MILMAACSSHPVKCRGPLRPINTLTGTTAGAPPQTPKPLSADPQP